MYIPFFFPPFQSPSSRTFSKHKKLSCGTFGSNIRISGAAKCATQVIVVYFWVDAHVCFRQPASAGQTAQRQNNPPLLTGTFSTSLRKVNIPSECKAIWATSENHPIKGDSEIQFDIRTAFEMTCDQIGKNHPQMPSVSVKVLSWGRGGQKC